MGMRQFQLLRSVLLLALGLAPMAHGAAPEMSTAKPTYSLAARLAFSPETREACLGVESNAPETGCGVPVGEQLHDAYGRALRRMFVEASGDAAAQIEIAISIDRAEIETVVEGRRLVLETRAVLRVPASGEIDRLKSYGRSAILGAGPESIANAAERASEEASRDFEREFPNSPQVVNWLVAQGIEPVGSTFAWPLRGERVTFADLSGGIVSGGGDGAVGGGLARFGVAWQWFVVQGIVGKWSPSFDTAPVGFQPNDTRAPAQLDTFDLGVEAGPVLRLGASMELRAGLGGHFLWGSANVDSAASGPPVKSSKFSRLTPSFFGAFQSAFLPTRSGMRIRAGIEVRRYVSTTVGFPDLSRTVPIADTYVGLYLGLELPWNKRVTGVTGAAQ